MKQIAVILIHLLAVIFCFAQTEAITFESDGLTLNGTLHLPSGDGPFAVAILVHDSGPLNQYQTIELLDANSQCLYPDLFMKTIENFKDIATHLSNNGIAVLTYDKRNFTYSETLDIVTLSTKDFVTDIENAVAFVKTQPKLAADKIFLAGHSQGSALIPLAAKNSGDVAGLISLAGAVTPPDTLVANQFKNLYWRCLSDTVSGNLVAERFYKEFSKIRNNELPDTVQIAVAFPGYSEAIPYGYPIFWKDWLEMADNVLINYESADLPMLFIQGNDDYNVPYSEVYRFENGMPANLTTTKVYEGVNHLLTTADNPAVSENILNDITSWILTGEIISAVSEFLILDDFDIKAYNKTIFIESKDGTHLFEQVVVFDLTGRLLNRADFKNKKNLTIETNQTNQLLIISFFNDKQIVSKEVFIK